MSKQAHCRCCSVSPFESVVMNHRQCPQAFFGQATAMVIHLRQIAIAPLNGGRATMELPCHPFSPFQPALQLIFRQGCRERISLQILRGLLPSLVEPGRLFRIAVETRAASFPCGSIAVAMPRAKRRHACRCESA